MGKRAAGVLSNFVGKGRAGRCTIPPVTSEEKQQISTNLKALAEANVKLDLGAYDVMGARRDKYDVVSIQRALPYLLAVSKVRPIVPHLAVISN